ncbi:MAG: N(4)-(beta-N-acetylglucosaminyl)-L-asparaginase [Verrucomicrobiales bacterium]|nr:N(4)-(beta-N-acetylglucosaminyl)-L-asparaginase [Verrucomicrobiales bacterium]
MINPSAADPSFNRRRFLGTVANASLGSALLAAASGCRTSTGGAAPARAGSTLPLIVSTWPFGKPANEKALQVLQAGGGRLDAIVDGISVTEHDLSVSSVGAGGDPNAEGVVSLDACIMDGPTHKCGSVAAVEGILPVIGLARAVMEKTRHVMLVGDGARRFALANGFKDTDLLTEAARRRWQEWKARQTGGQPASAPPDSHDTIAMVILGSDGQLAGGCSTSGLSYKLPGRVGDSPIIGSGLYVDNDVGAAGATGVGENILRFCGTFQVVELMRAGASPAEACAETIRRIQRKHPAGTDLAINFLAIDRRGRFGAAGTGDGFPYAVTYPGYSEVLKSVAVPARA